MIKINKGDFYEKQIHELNSTLFVKKVFEDFCRLKFPRTFKNLGYHMTISLLPVKVKSSSLLIHKTIHPRHDTLDLSQLEKSKYCFICQKF